MVYVKTFILQIGKTGPEKLSNMLKTLPTKGRQN